jgi:hypothetical protein
MDRSGRAASSILVVALLLALACVSCSTPGVSLGPRAAWLVIDGNVGAASTGNVVSTDSSTDDLGLDSSVVFAPRASLDWSPIHVTVSALMAGYSGDGEATGRLSLGDIEIEAGTDVETDLSMDLLTGSIVYDILPIPEVELGIGLGVGSVWYDLSVQQKGSSEEVSQDGILPIAFLTARAAADLGPVSVLGTVSGISIEFEDDDVSFIEVDLSAGYRVFGEDSMVEGRIMAGYRYVDFDYTYRGSRGRLEADLTLQGPYVGFDLVF